MKTVLFLFAISFFSNLYAQTSVSPVECIAPFYHGPFLQSLAAPCSRFAGINSPDLGIVVGVYPNPAYQLIKIQSYDLPIESITVYGSNGEIIKTPYSINPWSNGMTITSIDISTLKAGNYFIRINNENQKTCGLKSIPFTKY